MSVTILGIESSCDDTSAAVLRDTVLLSNVIASQRVHEAYGGVVPELASRAHQQNIVPVVSEAIRQAGIDRKDIDASLLRVALVCRDRSMWVPRLPRGWPWRSTSRWSM